MTWKSMAAASGATVVATWLASYAPVGGPRENPAPVPSPARTETAAADIQREADRLHARMDRVASFKLPQRNLFRFGERPVAPAVPRQPPPAVVAEIPASVPEPPAIRMKLSGIGEDVAGDEVIRTAIISGPDDVHVVKIGDTIGGTYKVTKIDADAVELTRLDDNSTLRLTLR